MVVATYHALDVGLLVLKLSLVNIIVTLGSVACSARNLGLMVLMIEGLVMFDHCVR